MRTSQFPLNTVKETPADAEITSHQLMIRAGIIKRIGSGLYTWTPIGLRVLRKVEAIIRDEMEKAGVAELLMPCSQPAELWKESGRWDKYGAELLRFKDRHNHDFCFGPTHEEIITDYARRELKSYKQLPVSYYQIQTKFRDEIRPRFGVMRAREFLMKDAYSFNIDQASLQSTYDIMYQAYCNIFNQLGLTYRPVEADTGSIGGNGSHEFHVLAQSGEDAIAVSDTSNYAANIELAPTLDQGIATDGIETKKEIHTPNAKTIESVSQFLNVSAQKTLKTLIVKGNKAHPLIALVLRGDHKLNEIKAEKLEHILSPLEMATEDEIQKTIGCLPGSIGPLGLSIPIYADFSALACNDFICGSNKDDYHFTGISWNRDCPKVIAADLRNIVEGDPSPDGKGTINIVRGIEVGHIFQLGTTYSEKMKATVLDQNGKPKIMMMGCYGIGVSRIIGAAIEQKNDERGIIWSDALAPFQLAIAPVNAAKSEEVKKWANKIYAFAIKNNYNVVIDDRNLRPGVMFSDLELIGIPHTIVIGDRVLKENCIEYKKRNDANQKIPLDDIEVFLDKLFTNSIED